MNDEYLDSFLMVLKEKGDQAWKQALLTSSKLGDTNNDFDASIAHLAQLQLISQERSGYDYLLTITTKGKRFIETGGFMAESQRNDAAAQTAKNAKKARIISILAIIISALVALLVCYINFISKHS